MSALFQQPKASQRQKVSCINNDQRDLFMQVSPAKWDKREEYWSKTNSSQHQQPQVEKQAGHYFFQNGNA